MEKFINGIIDGQEFEEEFYQIWRLSHDKKYSSEEILKIDNEKLNENLVFHTDQWSTNGSILIQRQNFVKQVNDCIRHPDTVHRLDPVLFPGFKTDVRITTHCNKKYLTDYGRIL